MEPGLIEQRLAWLEEQHAKAVQHASKVAERVHELEAAVAKVSHQGQELSADVSRVTAAASRLQQFEDSLHRHRQEVSRLLGESEERRSSQGEVAPAIARRRHGGDGQGARRDPDGPGAPG